MTLAAGTKLGAYEIAGALGAGGMGEVYRATDTKLGRDVAIKTLPATLAGDTDRLARFEREAKLLATLSHAHIAAVYGLDEHDGTLYIAMELVEGETLEEKLKAGALPVEDALRLGLQIAQALEAAHDKGVVHRDLKPANVMITPDGVVKVLDFGLAKAFSGDPNEASPGHSPALSLAMTQQGLVLGTAGYMSPEQASGQATDQRADVWAFGVVLYEMLTGLPLFSGESVPHILADVLRTEPDWGRLPKQLHPRIRELLERCLEKKPRNRYAGIADARVDIEAALADPQGMNVQAGPGGAAASASLGRRLLPWAAGIALAVLAGVAAWTMKPAAPRAPIYSVYALPAGRTLTIFGASAVDITRDGRQLVYGAAAGFYLHRMGEFFDNPITNAGGAGPLFSPDGQSVAYRNVVSNGGTVQIMRIPTSGGAAIPLGINGAVGSNVAIGLDWEPDGTIIYSTDDGVWRVSDNGGEPKQIIEAEPGELDVVSQLLPGGEWLLMTTAHGEAPIDWDTGEIVAESLSTHERRSLRQGGSSPRYSPTGHLIYAVGNTLYAVAFDPGSVKTHGTPIQVVQGVRREVNTGNAQYRFSDNGTLVYVPGSVVEANSVTLTIVDGSGARKPLGGPAGDYADPRVSPNGDWAAYTRNYPDGQDIEVFDMSGNTAPRRLTFDGQSRFPVWSADSERIAYQSTREGTPGIYWQRADGNGAAERLTSAKDGESDVPDSFSPDGERLSYTVSRDDDSQIWTVELATNEAEPLIAEPGTFLSQSVFSPNGQWIAYQSTRGDQTGIFVQPLPVTGTKYQVPNTSANHHPAWSSDGSELYYFPNQGRFESVRVTTEPSFAFGKAMPLSNLPMNQPPATHRQYDVMPDGSGLLGAVAGTGGDEAGDSIRIVYNWFDELKRLVPTD